MYESSPRSREVANALFQIDRLTDDQTRAILRHITIDDAVLNEAQCSHVACVINGTLNKAPREGVNASLTCGTGLDAASHWEKSFASHPGHVSATFRKSSNDTGVEADRSTKQMVLFKPDESAPVAANSSSSDSKLSFSGPPELQGLSIINQGQLTLHYHSYNAGPSIVNQPTTESRKHSLEENENEGYSEALASLMDCNLSSPDRSAVLSGPKRRRKEEPEAGMGEAGTDTAETEIEHAEVRAELTEDNTQNHQDEVEEQAQVKREDDQPLEQTRKKTRQCKKCGKMFSSKKNRGTRKRCCFHPGTLQHHPEGLMRTAKSGAPKKTLYDTWSCCHLGANATGCVREKHEEDTG